jgi:hypothetical protein
MEGKPQRRLSSWWWWGIGYVVLAGTVVSSLLAAREWALTELSTSDSAAAWTTWRDDVRAQQLEPAPVQRRVPQSAEPPALVLMRDYLGVSLAAAILFSTLLYSVVVWMLVGMLAAPPPNESPQDAATT